MAGLLKVWSKFSAVNKAGNILNLWIVDMPEYLTKDVINQYMDCFVKEETSYRAAGVPKSAEAMEELREFMLKKLTKENGFNIAICCLENDENKIKNIIGASNMKLILKGEEKPTWHPKTEAMNKVLEIFNGMACYYDEMKELNIDCSFVDIGLFVHPHYRGLGIAQELFKARRVICKEHGIQIHGAWMTSYGTQKAAERDGWETVCEINYEEFGKQHGVTFEFGPPSCKFMITRVS